MSETTQSSPLQFTRLESPASRWTFEPERVRRFVERRLEGLVLNLFAGQTELRHDGQIIRVDINPDVTADYHMDALEFVTQEDGIPSFDTVILDPPYNVRKAREKYNGRMIGEFTKIKDELPDLVAPNGRVIHFGYSSYGMGPKRGFELEEVALICHKGDHNDTIVTVERLANNKLTSYTDTHS